MGFKKNRPSLEPGEKGAQLSYLQTQLQAQERLALGITEAVRAPVGRLGDEAQGAGNGWRTSSQSGNLP